MCLGEVLERTVGLRLAVRRCQSPASATILVSVLRHLLTCPRHAIHIVQLRFMDVPMQQAWWSFRLVAIQVT